MIQKSMRVAQLFLLGILVSWLAGLSACSNDKQHTTAAPEIVRDVTLLKVQKTTVPDYTEATGTVRAAQSAQLSSQVMGTITRVNVHEGDRVRRGEVLITIDAAQQRSAYDSANAGLQASQETIAAADADYAWRNRPCALPDAVRQEVGEPAGVRRGEDTAGGGQGATRRRSRWPHYKLRPGFPRPTQRSASQQFVLRLTAWWSPSWQTPAPWRLRAFHC